MAEIIQPPKKRKSLKVVIQSFDCSGTTISASPANINDTPNHSETPKDEGVSVESSVKISKTVQRRRKKLPVEDNTEPDQSNPVATKNKKLGSTSKSCNKTSTKSDKSEPLIKSNICRYCGKFYATTSELKEHEINHTTNKELLCPQCGMGFARRSYLVEHACIHSGEKPHKCYYCDRAFTLRCNLVRHVRIHTGEKPFVCDICEKDFTLKKNMIEHKRTHTGEKPFNCKLCEQSFSRRSSLVRHLRIHTGEKCYECNECHKKFSWKYYLQRHMVIHSQNKPRKRKRRDNDKQKTKTDIPKLVPPNSKPHRNNNKKKEETVISQQIQQNDIMNCKNHIQENLIEIKPTDQFVEHSYAMESSPIDESNIIIKEEFEKNDEIEFKEESFDDQEYGMVGNEVPLSQEQKQSVGIGPIIISVNSSKADISTPPISPPQTNPVVSQSNDVIHFKTKTKFDKCYGRKLHIKLHRLEDVPFEMQEE